MKIRILHRMFLAGASLGAFLSARADYPSAVSALNPVAYYRLDNTNAVPSELSATNSGSLGTALNGIYQSMSDSRGTQGAIVGDPDTSVSIDASAGALITVPYSAAYNPNAPFTVEFWANPANTDSGKHAAVISMVNGQNAGNGNDRSGWAVQKLGDQWQFVLGFDHSDGSTFYATTISSAAGSVAVGTWQHVVAVYTPGTVSLYLNGVLAASDTPAQPLLPNTLAPLLIGNRGYGGWNYVGLMDEVAVYTNALTADQIKAHYTAGTGGAPYAPLIRSQNPALYYRLDEPSLNLPVAKNIGTWGPVADGSYRAGSTPGAPGLVTQFAYGFDSTNRAVLLDGTNGFVKIPAQMSTLNEATFVAWVKRDGREPSFSGIIFQRGGSPDASTGINFQDSGTSLGYTWNNDAKSYNYNPGLILPDQSWTFVAVTVAADHAVLYLGTPAGLQAATNTISHDPHDFSIASIDFGWDTTSNARIMKGELDEVALFDKSLSYNQISGLFKAALPAILSLTRTPADPVYEGSKVTFTSGTAGSGTNAYQWSVGTTAITGATNSSLTLPGVRVADSGDYALKVVSGGISLTSAPVHLSVKSSPPILTQSPQSATRFVNGAQVFKVSAIGTTPLTFQWKHGTSVIASETNSSLVITDLQSGDAGDYIVEVTNPLGTNAATATLTILTPSLFAAQVIDGGPIDFWPLSETNGTVAFDYWGGRDGTAGSGVTAGGPGPVPPAFKGFPASNTGYSLANGGSVDVPPLNLNKNTMTIVTWIQPTGAEPDFAGLVFSRGSGTVSGLDYNVGGQIGYHWNDAANTYNFASGLMPGSNVWNFVALTVEPTQATLYLDSGTGLQSAVNTVDHAASGFAGNLKFGLDDNGGGRVFKGNMGPVAIFDRTLSAAEIGALRNAGVAGTYTGPLPATFVQSPVSQTVVAGTAYTLSGRASGSPPIAYQWHKNGTNLPGAIRSRLSFTSAQVADSGMYQLFAIQGTASASSAIANFVVNPVPEYLNATNGLVLHLTFDGNYSDSSGRGNNGTAQGMPTFVPGVIGTGALQYSTDVSSTSYNYVSLGTPNDLKFGTDTNFTVSYWIKYTGLIGDLPFLSSANNSYGNPGLTFAASYKLGGWSYWVGGDTGSGGLYGPDSSINDGQWHSLVHVFDRTGNATTYLDGAIVDVRSMAGVGNVDSGNGFNIGQDPTGAYGESGVEQIDDLGIWRRALTEYEAQSIYIVGKNHGRSFDSVGPATLNLSIQFDGTQATITWNTGTLQSATTATGPWTAVPGATAPTYHVTPSEALRFYRVLGN